MTTLYQASQLEEAIVVSRPSKSIKSPYVADITLCTTGETVLAHSPSLGCCGLADKTAKILVSKSTNKTTKCDYIIYFSIVSYNEKEVVVGIHPRLAETITENALKQNCLKTLQNVKSYLREQTVICEDFKSRFDFTGVDEHGCPFIMEVKSVPLCIYETTGENTSFFPDGYRKKKGDVVSPRALKHIRELEELKLRTKNRCIMCYVIQRNDVAKFQTSANDPEYKNAVKRANLNGVEIITLCIEWTNTGTGKFLCCDLPFEL